MATDVNIQVLDPNEAQREVSEGAVRFRFMGGAQVLLAGIQEMTAADFLTTVRDLDNSPLTTDDVALRVNGEVERDPNARIRPGDEVVAAKQSTNG